MKPSIPNYPSYKMWWIFISTAGVLYLLSLHAYYVGFFNDDAFYLIGARSLLHGFYRELNQPGLPPLMYMPGYPLLLCPFSFFSPQNFLPHQIFSVAMTLAALVLLGVFLKNSYSTSTGMASLAVSLFNPF